MPAESILDAYYPLSPSIPPQPGQSDFLRWQQRQSSDGVYRSELSQCVVLENFPTDMTVFVHPGRTNTRGVFGEAGVPHPLAISPNASGQPRIDWIVARLDVQAVPPTVKFAVIEGVPSATPVAPTVSRVFDADGVPLVYDIMLAQVTVASGDTAITNGEIRNITQYATGRGFTYWGSYNPGANDIQVPDGKLVMVDIGGAYTIQNILHQGYTPEDGSILVLRFQTTGAIVTFGGNIEINSPFKATANQSTLTLMRGPTGWRELCRAGGQFYLARLNLTANASAPPGPLSTVTFNAMRYDSGGVYNGVNWDRLVAPVSGVYAVGGQTIWDVGGGPWHLTRLVKNGTLIIGTESGVSPAGQYHYQNVHTHFRFTAGEDIRLMVQHASAGAETLLTSVDDGPALWMSLIREL